MNKRILFVDDDINILNAYKRQFRKQFDVHIAQGPDEALQLVKASEAFAVVVSDFSMPGMNGVEFLTEVKNISVNSVRVMLTGFANTANAIDAVNNGNVFRFLAKPCPPEKLVLTLNAGIKQYGLITAEKELLEKTLFGSIEVMSQILSLVNPLAFSSTSRIKSYVRHMVNALNLRGRWRFELAAMLCQLGYITLPVETTSKIHASQPLTDTEQKIFDAHPAVAASMLKKIPRLSPVALMVAGQMRDYKDYQQTNDALPDDEVLLGSLMLRAVLDFDLLISKNMSLSQAVEAMRQRKGVYHPMILQCLATIDKVDRSMEIKSIYVKDLAIGMIADENILSVKGLLLIAKGQEVSNPMIERLRSFAKTTHVIEPFRMKVP